MEILFFQNFKFHKMIYLLKKEQFKKDTLEFKQKKIDYKREKKERKRIILLNEPANIIRKKVGRPKIIRNIIDPDDEIIVNYTDEPVIATLPSLQIYEFSLLLP